MNEWWRIQFADGAMGWLKLDLETHSCVGVFADDGQHVDESTRIEYTTLETAVSPPTWA